MNELALFAGAGGGLLATHHLLGWRCVGYVEMAKYPCQVLEARIRDGLLSKAPIFCCTVREFITSGFARKYRGVVDVITAGFPCQPFSQAGKRLADRDERNGWPDTIRAIRIIRPNWLLLENVPGLVTGKHGYFSTIIRHLAQAGYDAEWACLSAAEVGANHKRNRVWIVGWRRDLPNTNGAGVWEQSNGIGRGLQAVELELNGLKGEMAYSQSAGFQDGNSTQSIAEPQLERFCGTLPNASCLNVHGGGASGSERNAQLANGGWWAVEPGVGRVVNGMAGRVERLRAIGNGQVPAVVEHVWRALVGE